MIKYRKIKNNLVHNTAIINWKDLIIGKGNKIGPYVVIGNDAQHPKNKSCGKIIIGDNNVFNEFTNIHLPTKLKKKTVIGNKNYFMNSCTIDHDCFIEDNIVASSNCVLGGNVILMKNSQLGIRTTIHQNQVIGSYSMIGMNSVITKKTKIKPGYVFYGKPAKLIKKNMIGLRRNKITDEILKKEYKRFLTLKKNNEK